MRDLVLTDVYRTNYLVNIEMERRSTGGKIDLITPARSFTGNSRPAASSTEFPGSPVGRLRIS